MTLHTHFTEPTTHYWQCTIPSQETAPPPPYKYSYPATLPNNRTLLLPIRPLPHDPTKAVASLLVNHASIQVVQELSSLLSQQLLQWQAKNNILIEAVVGLPTLGLTLAPLVAKALGLDRYIPLGHSLKFWYEDTLSVSTNPSITSPNHMNKKLYLDPNLLELMKGKKVVLVDDAVSTGATLKIAWDFLERVGCEVVVVGVVMRQGERWREVVGGKRVQRVLGVLESPLLRAVEGGWDVRVS